MSQTRTHTFFLPNPASISQHHPITCTAWPVDDVAARTFALTLYANLLGLRRENDGENPTRDLEGPQPMYAAMQQARLSIADNPAAYPGGARTWGAYQHYGSPYFRFFNPER